MKWYWLPVLLTVAVAVFFSAISLGWLSDDYEVVLLTQQPNAWQTIWTNPLGGNVFRPVGFSTLLLEAKLGAIAPVVSHSVNLFFHALCAWVLSLIVFRLSKHTVAAILSAGLFVLYPAHVEPVAWVAGRFDVLMTMFALTAVYCFLRSERAGGRWWWGSLGATALACLTKEPAFILPILLIVVGLLHSKFRQQSWRSKAATLAPFIAVAGLIIVWRYQVVGSWLGGYEQFGASVVQSITGADWHTLFITPMTMFVRWVNLGLLGEFTSRATILNSSVVLLATGVVLALFAWQVRKLRVLIVGLGVTWLLLLPTVPLLHTVSRTLEGSRFWYWPSAALLATVSIILAAVRRRHLRTGLIAFLLIPWLIGLQVNLIPWTQAAQQSKAITKEFAQLSSTLPTDSWLLFERVPDNYFGAYVFRRGLGEWLDSEYPGTFLNRLVAHRTSKTPFTSCAALAKVAPRFRILRWQTDALRWDVRQLNVTQPAPINDFPSLPEHISSWTVGRAAATKISDGYSFIPQSAPVTIQATLPTVSVHNVPALLLDATITAGRNPMPLSVYWSTNAHPADEYVQHLILPVPATNKRATTLLPLCQYAPWQASEPITNLRLQFPRDLRTLIIHSLTVTNAD